MNNNYFSNGYKSLLKHLSNQKSLPCARSESGRSLVEMLGTLAIMGILTIGGIAGFNYAMNKQRANATVNYVNELAVLGTGQMLAGGTPKLLDYPKQTPSGYPADMTTDDDKPNTFYIEISEVPAAVCDEIISRLDGWKMVNDIGFFNGVGACADQEKVDMWFEISANADKDLNSYRCETDADCAGWANMHGATCASDCIGWKNAIGTCNDKHRCEYTCKSGYVQTSAGCCATKNVFNGGCCYGDVKTDEDGNKICCGANNITSYCCKEGSFLAQTSGDGCILCDDPNPIYTYFPGGVYPYLCNICPNRKLSGWYCLPPDQDCPAGQIAKNGICYCPLDKPVKDHRGNCYPCDVTHSKFPPMLKDAPIELKKYGYDALSFYCNRPTGGGYAGYKACASGEVGLPGGYTITLTDGSSYRVSSSYGECKSCSDIDKSQLKYQAWCESCGGKWVGKAWDKGTCHKP